MSDSHLPITGFLSQPMSGQCHVHINPSDSAKEEKKNCVEERSASIITEIAAEYVDNHNQ
jgi:hypothetical protein